MTIFVQVMLLGGPIWPADKSELLWLKVGGTAQTWIVTLCWLLGLFHESPTTWKVNFENHSLLQVARAAKILCTSFHQKVESLSPLLALEPDLVSAIECCGSTVMPILSQGLRRLYTLCTCSWYPSYHPVSEFRLACWMREPTWPPSSQARPS